MQRRTNATVPHKGVSSLLFKILPNISCPSILLSLIWSFHNDIQGTVQVNGISLFRIHNAVKQDRTLTRAFFMSFLVLLLKHVFNTSTDRIYLHTRSDGFNLAHLRAKTKVPEFIKRPVCRRRFTHPAGISVIVGLLVCGLQGLRQNTDSLPVDAIDYCKLTVLFTYLGSTINSSWTRKSTRGLEKQRKHFTVSPLVCGHRDEDWSVQCLRHHHTAVWTWIREHMCQSREKNTS